MQRLNVRQSQIRECIERSLFAVDRLPPLQKGEILLLQLVRSEVLELGKLHSRIEFALMYDHSKGAGVRLAILQKNLNK